MQVLCQRVEAYKEVQSHFYLKIFSYGDKMENYLVITLALTFTCWVSLDNLLNHFETQFLHLGVQKFKWG